VRHKKQLYFGIPIGIGMLFWNALLAYIAILAGILYFLYTKGMFRLLWNLTSRAGGVEVPAGVPVAAGAESEPTMITLVTRAPDQLLGVDHDAGTGTIFHAFYQQMREERNDGLRLNKKGRRLTAAKNEMMLRRRKKGRPEWPSSSARAKLDLKNTLHTFLEERPVYSRKVVQFKHLSRSQAEQYRVGVEVEDIGLTSTYEKPDRGAGRGSSRLVIQSQSGRLLSNSGEGQVAFLPGTRFLIVGRAPWQNPDFPGSPPGFTFELVELE
jgi:hypothetical protein